MPLPIRERLAVVRCGTRRGAGYLLTPSLLLTAAHLVAGRQEVRVTLPGPRGEVTGLRHWRRYDEGSGADAALLTLSAAADGTDETGATDTADAADAAHGAADPGERWARATSLAPIRGCRAALLPDVPPQDATGTYRPGAGLFSGRDLLALPGAAARAVPPGTPVFAGDALLGMVTGGASGPEGGLPAGALTVMPVQLLRRDPDFHGAVHERGYAAPPTVAPPGQLTDGAAVHEARYAAYVAHRHGALPAAYRPREAAPVRTGPGGPVPAEQVLAGHDRVLLRGPAGSGKTTLVQWLALAAARQELGPHAEHLRGLVPYVLPLRAITGRDRLPAPADFLDAVDIPLSPPPGWAERVLREGRALVLVDGLDDGIDGAARERAGNWLRGLLLSHPGGGNRWMVTSRSGAASWLPAEGFAELTLTPPT